MHLVLCAAKGWSHEKNHNVFISQRWLSKRKCTIKVHKPQPQGTFATEMRTIPSCALKKRFPIRPGFYWRWSRQSLQLRHLIYHGLRGPVASDSGALRPLKGRGASLPQCGIRAHAGTGYYASSVHENNTSPQPAQCELCAVHPGEAELVKLEGWRENVQQLFVRFKWRGYVQSAESCETHISI